MAVGRRPDVALIVPHMGQGGLQSVTAQLSAGWVASGKRVAVITLFGGDTVHTLHPDVARYDLYPSKGATIPWPAVGPLRVRLQSWSLERLPELHAAQRRVRASAQGWIDSLAVDSLVGRAVAIPFARRQHPRRSARRGVATRASRLARLLEALGRPPAISFATSANVIALLASRAVRSRLVISERNDPARQQAKYPLDDLRRLLYPTADAITANSRGVLAGLAALAPDTPVHFIPNPIAIPVQPAPCDSSRFLIVGRLSPQKAHDVLLPALARLPDRLAHWTLDVLGDGPLSTSLKEQARDLGIQGRVRWAGHVAPAEWYQSAGAFVLPSRFEGTPNALLEAMAHGLPAIVADASPGPLELIRPGRDGLVVPVNDVTALTNAMARLADDLPLRRALGDSARERVREFELPGILPQWEALIWPGDV
jgi:glycosyltransferase involved in cell wall biosynthesis